MAAKHTLMDVIPSKTSHDCQRRYYQPRKKTFYRFGLRARFNWTSPGQIWSDGKLKYSSKYNVIRKSASEALPFFRIQLENEIIYLVFVENFVSYSTYKKWFQTFWEENFDHEYGLCAEMQSNEDRLPFAAGFFRQGYQYVKFYLNYLVPWNFSLVLRIPLHLPSFLGGQVGDFLCSRPGWPGGAKLRVTRQAIFKRLNKLGLIQKEGHSYAMSLVSRFKQKNFFHKIVTRDEKWVIYDNPKRRKLWVYKYLSKPFISTPKPNIHAKKVLLRISWDRKGVMY